MTAEVLTTGNHRKFRRLSPWCTVDLLDCKWCQFLKSHHVVATHGMGNDMWGVDSQGYGKRITTV